MGSTRVRSVDLLQKPDLLGIFQEGIGPGSQIFQTANLHLLKRRDFLQMSLYGSNADFGSGLLAQDGRLPFGVEHRAGLVHGSILLPWGDRDRLISIIRAGESSLRLQSTLIVAADSQASHARRGASRSGGEDSKMLERSPDRAGFPKLARSCRRPRSESGCCDRDDRWSWHRRHQPRRRFGPAAES